MKDTEEAFRKTFGSQPLVVCEHPPCELTDLAWYYKVNKNARNGAIRVLAQIDLHGCIFVVMALDNHSFWDVVIFDRDGNGWQAMPIDTEHAFQCDDEQSLKECKRYAIREFIKYAIRLPQEKLQEWYAQSVAQLNEQKGKVTE